MLDSGNSDLIFMHGWGAMENEGVHIEGRFVRNEVSGVVKILTAENEVLYQ